MVMPIIANGQWLAAEESNEAAIYCLLVTDLYKNLG